MVLSAALDHALFGASPVGTHLTSLVLYGLATGSVFALSFAVLRKREYAVIAALVWAWMPLHAELVVAASYREDLFAIVGVCTALALFLVPTPHAHGWGRAALVAGSWSVGLMGKESALVLLVLLPWLTPFPWQRDAKGAPRWASFFVQRERSITLLFLVLGVYLMWRYSLVLQGDGVARREGLSSLHALPRYLLWGVSESLLPVRVQPFYSSLGDARATFWLPLAAMLALAFGVRARPEGKALGMLLLGALLTAPLVGPLNERADRYLGFTTVGTAWLAALGVAWLARQDWPQARRSARLIALLCALLLAMRAASLARIWSSDLTLFQEATERVPESAKAWDGLAWAERERGRLDAAEACLARSLRAEPGRPISRVSLAYMRLSRADREGALRILEAMEEDGLEETPGFAHVWRCASDEGSPEQAAACVRGR